MIARPSADLVGNHLRGRANTAEQRPAVIRGPSAERDAVNADSDRRQDVERGGIDIGRLQRDSARADLHHVAERHHREGDYHRKQGEERREGVEKLVRAVGHEVFLGKKLQRIGEQRVDQAQVGQAHPLAEPGYRGAIGADTVLDKRAALALDPQQDARQVEDHHHDDDRLDRSDQKVNQHGRQARRQASR